MYASRLCKAYNGAFFQEMSLQQLMDCPRYISGSTTLDSHGCAGAFTDSVLGNLNRAAGGFLVSEACNPYVSQFHTYTDWNSRYPRGADACSERCYSTGPKGSGIGARKYYFNPKTTLTSIEAMKQSIYDNGPLPVGLYVYTSFFGLNYTDHTYDPQPSETLLGSHGALIFGWEDDMWLLQNSWDLTWGHDGNFRAKMGNSLAMIETYFDNATIDAIPEVPDFMFKSPREPSVLQKEQQFRVEWVTRADVSAATVQIEMHRYYSSDEDWEIATKFWVLAVNVDNSLGHGSAVVTIPKQASTDTSYDYFFVVRNGTHTSESEHFRLVDSTESFINDVITPDFGPADNFGARAALYQPHYTAGRVMTIRWSTVGISSYTVNIQATKLDGTSTVGNSVTVPNTGIYRWTLPALCDPGDCERSYLLRLTTYSYSSISRYSFPFKYYQYSMQWDFAEDIAGTSYRDGDTLTLTPVNTTTNAATGVQVWLGAEYPTAFQSAFLSTPPNASSIVINATEHLPTRYASVFMTSAVMGSSYVEALPIVITDAQTVAVAADLATVIQGQTVVFNWTTTGKFFDYVDIVLTNSTNFAFPILLGLDASLQRFAFRVASTVLPADTYTVSIRNAQNHAVISAAAPAVTLVVAADTCSALSTCGTCVAAAGCGWCTDSYNGASTTSTSGTCFHVSADKKTALTGYCPIGAMASTCDALAKPTITAVSPSTAAKGVAVAMTITGTNFVPETLVTMGGTGYDHAVLNQVVVDSTKITFDTRPDELYNIYVVNPDGQEASDTSTLTRTTTACPTTTGWTANTASYTSSESGTLSITGAAYVADMNCQAYLYTSPYGGTHGSGQQTMFNFTSFDLAPGDSLTLYNGQNMYSPVIATFTSTSTLRTAYCQNNYCYLRFLSGASDKTGHNGFSVDYMTVSMSSKCPVSSGSSISTFPASVELKASEYTDWMDCTWTLYKYYNRENGNVFKITIDHLETEKDADFVRIYAGDSTSNPNQYPLIATLSGNNITQTTYYAGTAYPDEFAIRFTSNELLSPVSSTKGFKITVEIASAADLAGSAPCPVPVADLTASEGELVLNQTDLVAFMSCNYVIAPAAKTAGQVVSFGIAANGLLSQDSLEFFDGATSKAKVNGNVDHFDHSSSASDAVVCATGPCKITVNTNTVYSSSSYSTRGTVRIFWNLASATAPSEGACPLQSGKTFTERTGAIYITQQDQANLIDSAYDKRCGYTIAPVKAADEVVVFYVEYLETYYGFFIYDGPDTTSTLLINEQENTPTHNPPEPILTTCTAAQCLVQYHTRYYIYGGALLRWATMSKDAMKLFNAPASAGQTFTEAAGTLAVGNDEYVALEDAYWIVAPAGKTASQMVVFTVNYASIQSGDHLYIYDGAADTAPHVLDQQDTKNMPGYTSSNVPAVVACSSASCRIRLLTERNRWATSSIPSGGFSLSWKLEENRCATKRSCGKCLATPGCSWCQASSSSTSAIGHCASYLEEYSLYGLCGSYTAGWYGNWYDFTGSYACPAFSGPDPVVTSIVPASTTTGVATPVVITGYNFHNTTTSQIMVTICGAACTDVYFASETSISCTAPVFTFGAYCDVVVWNDGFQPSDELDYFHYIGSGPGPVGGVAIYSVTPASGSRLGGTHVTLSGKGFESGATVKFCDSAALAVSVVSANTITCTTPARTETGICSVSVINPDTTYAVLSAGYTFTPEGSSSPVTPPSQVGAIVGGVVGGVGGAIVVAVIIIIACCCCKKKGASTGGDSYKNASRSQPEPGAPMTMNPMRSQA